MKKRKITKNLVLSKRTIASLSNNKLNKIIGGGSAGCVTADFIEDGQDEPLDNGSLLKVSTCPNPPD